MICLLLSSCIYFSDAWSCGLCQSLDTVQTKTPSGMIVKRWVACLRYVGSYLCNRWQSQSPSQFPNNFNLNLLQARQFYLSCSIYTAIIDFFD